MHPVAVAVVFTLNMTATGSTADDAWHDANEYPEW